MRYSLMFALGFMFLVSNLVSLSANAYITDKSQYYGVDFQSQLNAGHLENQDLLNTLHQITQDGHIKHAGSADTFVKNCDGQKEKCVQHAALGYDKARKLIFGNIHLEQLANGTYAVKDVYCEKYFTDADFKASGNIGPGLIPSSGSIINTEHTWPQSRFTSRFNTELQKSDVHHLYPTDSEMNSRRSSLRFGTVEQDKEKLKCSQDRLGSHKGETGMVFEPPVLHRGNVARSLFYFATRYEMKISPGEEAALRQWHKDDPVNDFELKRNDMVEDAQGNRNPFVDYPELVDHIKTFSFETTKN